MFDALGVATHLLMLAGTYIVLFLFDQAKLRLISRHCLYFDGWLFDRLLEGHLEFRLGFIGVSGRLLLTVPNNHKLRY